MTEKQEDFEEVIIPKKEYEEYQKQEAEILKQKENVKIWKEKYMQQTAEYNKLKEENSNKEMKEKYEALLKEAQMVYDESQKLERGIIKLIKSLG